MGQSGSSYSRRPQPFPVQLSGYQPAYDTTRGGYPPDRRSRKGKEKEGAYPGSSHTGYVPNTMYPYQYPSQIPGFYPQAGAPQPGFIPPRPSAERRSQQPQFDANTTGTNNLNATAETTTRPRRSSMRRSVPDAAPTPAFQPQPSTGNAPTTTQTQTQQTTETTSRQEPPMQSVLEPLPPANPAAFGPPGPRPRTPLRNPLPSPPQDLYDTSPYRSLLRDLPQNAALLARSHSTSAVTLDPERRGSGIFGKKKSKRGGLFHSLSSGGSSSRRRSEPVTYPGGYYNAPPPGNAMGQVPSRDFTGPTPMFVPPPPPVPPPSTSAQPQPQPQTSVPPVRFDHIGAFSGFLNHSPHRILYNNQTYPTATHLFEALKFIRQRPDLSERIRKTKAIHEVYPLSSSFQKHVRSDWGSVFLKTMQEVLYLKFKQHPNLRDLLMNTGIADIIYAEPSDAFWGEGESGQGTNQMGKALVGVRERLRAEGYGVGGGG